MNEGFGACHAVEIPFVFDTTGGESLRGLLGERPSQDVADLMHRVWIDFIAHGDPGWAPYNTEHRTTALLTDAVRPAGDPAGDERAVWEGIR